MDPISYRPIPSAPPNEEQPANTIVSVNTDISMEQLQQRLENFRWFTYCFVILICVGMTGFFMYQYIDFFHRKN